MQSDHPVVEGDDDEVSVRSQDSTIEEVSRTPAIGLAVYKNHHWQGFLLWKM